MARKAKVGEAGTDAAKSVKESGAGGWAASFPVVGIGASAGGLEALEQFFRNVPPDSGLAFVVVQHLDPTHKALLPELLQRATPMPIRQIKDRMKVEPNSVYVIPPNSDIGILHGKLHVTRPVAPRGLRLPIDFFFRSLAEELRERAIGVVLSGMGSDGTAGLRAIKEKDGLGLAQTPSSARFEAMPGSVIEAGLADIVALPTELPSKIIRYVGHSPLVSKNQKAFDAKSVSALEKAVLLLRDRTGNDFSFYKKSTLYRRVERRMGIHQIDRIANYVRYLQENPVEIDLLFKELLIGVTSFFRDAAAWDKLKSEVLPALIASRPGGGQLRAWVAGCSTGEEAYSLAIAFLEAQDELHKKGAHYTLQIFATDLDAEAVERGRQGLYPASIANDVSAERLERFFQKEGGGYRVGKAVREAVIFASHNITRDPPFTKLDLLTCRNLLIYLEPEMQMRLFPLFHYSLNPGGVLFLGSAESLGGFAEYFDTLFGKERLFRRRETATPGEAMMFPAAFSRARQPDRAALREDKPEASVEALTDKFILAHHAPATVLVSEEGDILYSSARTGKYLEPPVGKANLNVFAMAREGIRNALAGGFAKAKKDGGLINLRGLEVGTETERHAVDVTVRAMTEPAEMKGKYLLVFEDVPFHSPVEGAARSKSRKTSPESARVGELSRELQSAREELQTTKEEMQSSQEELKSANEELQSTNEELQSTNEELTTSREEMQSMNEELQSLNAEISSKLEELSRTSADMKNLLNSTDIATVFLDGQLRVRRFTDRATKIVKLIPGV